MYTVPVSFPPIDIKIMAVTDDDDDDDEPLQSIPFWQMGVLVRSGWGLSANKENWAHLVDAKHDINIAALKHWACPGDAISMIPILARQQKLIGIETNCIEALVHNC